MAAVKPEVLDKFDADQSVDEYAEMLGVPPKIVVSDDIVQATQDRLEQSSSNKCSRWSKQHKAPRQLRFLRDADTGGQNALTDVIGGLTQ